MEISRFLSCLVGQRQPQVVVTLANVRLLRYQRQKVFVIYAMPALRRFHNPLLQLSVQLTLLSFGITTIMGPAAVVRLQLK